MRVNYRSLELVTREADTSRRTVPVVIATETPVDRYLDGRPVLEVLECSKRAVDLGRSPLPLIESHDANRINIGLIEDVHVNGHKLRGTLRLGSSNRAAELWPDIEAGVIRGLSVGYRIHEVTPPDPDDVVRVTRWEPYEVSLVAVPADRNAGTYRSMQLMSEDDQGRPSRSERRAANRQQADTAAVQQQERERIARIMELGRRFNCADLAERAINDGRSEAAVRSAILDRWASHTPGSPPMGDAPELGGDYEQQGYQRGGGARGERYSLLRAIRALVDPSTMQAAQFELETSRQLAKEMGIQPKGLLVPLGELGARTLTGGSGGGANLVGNTHLSSSFIELLRARSIVMQLGATVFPGLVGNVTIPRQTATATAQWIAGDGADSLTASDPNFDGITLSPKTCGALTVLSRKFVIQSDPSGEQLVRNDLAASLATALDVAALTGTGTSNQPRGILNATGIATDDFAGATPTWAEVVAMESDLLAANVNPISGAYVTTPAIQGLLKTVEKASGSGEFIWTPAAERGLGMVNGYPAMSSSSSPAGKVILGNWGDLVLGFWRAIEVEVNPFHDFAAGSISLRALMHVDVAVRHGESFAVYSQP